MIRLWVYFYDLPGGDEFSPGDTSLLTLFLGSVLSGRFLIDEKGEDW